MENEIGIMGNISGLNRIRFASLVHDAKSQRCELRQGLRQKISPGEIV